MLEIMFTRASGGGLTDRFAYLRLTGLILIWAANWPLTKGVLGYISPFDFVFWRFWGAIVIMAAMTVARRQSLLPANGERTRLAVIGIVQIAFCMGLGTLGLTYVGAGRAAVLMYTMQLWALPIGWLVNDERITRMALIGGLAVFLASCSL